MMGLVQPNYTPLDSIRINCIIVTISRRREQTYIIIEPFLIVEHEGYLAESRGLSEIHEKSLQVAECVKH